MLVLEPSFFQALKVSSLGKLSMAILKLLFLFLSFTKTKHTKFTVVCYCSLGDAGRTAHARNGYKLLSSEKKKLHEKERTEFSSCKCVPTCQISGFFECCWCFCVLLLIQLRIIIIIIIAAAAAAPAGVPYMIRSCISNGDKC